MADEYLPDPITSDDEPVSRGSIDQEPAIDEIPEYIPDRRFVLLPTDAKTTPSPVSSDDERKRRGRRPKDTKLDPIGLPEMMREPSPYAWTKPNTLPGKSSLSDALLSPDANPPSAGHNFADIPRSVPASPPIGAVPHTSARPRVPSTHRFSNDRLPTAIRPDALPRRKASPPPRAAASSSEEDSARRESTDRRKTSLNAHRHYENPHASAPDVIPRRTTERPPRSSHHDLPYGPDDSAYVAPRRNTDKASQSPSNDSPYRTGDSSPEVGARKNTERPPRSSHYDLPHRLDDHVSDVPPRRNTDKTPRSSYHDLPNRPDNSVPLKSTTSHAGKQSEHQVDADDHKSSSRPMSARYTTSPPYSPIIDGEGSRANRSRADSHESSSSHSSPQPSPRLSKSSFAAIGAAGTAAALHHRKSASRLSRHAASEARDAVPRRMPTSHPVQAQSQLPYPDDEGNFQSLPREADHRYLNPDRMFRPEIQEHRASSKSATPHSSAPVLNERPSLPTRKSGGHDSMGLLSPPGADHQYNHTDHRFQSDLRDYKPSSGSAIPAASVPVSNGRPQLSTHNSGVHEPLGLPLSSSSRRRSTSSARLKTAAELKVLCRDLPICPRPVYTAEYDDWYTLEGCPHFDICPECLATIFGDTVYMVYFKRSTSRRGLGKTVEVRCDFNDAWIRLAWLLTLKREIPSLELIKALVNSSGIQAEEPCPGSKVGIRNWYSIRDGHGHFLRGFAVCSADVKKLQILFPGFRDLWQPLPVRASYSWGDDSGGLQRLCSLRPMRNNRFATFIDGLVAHHEPSYNRGRLPGTTDFVSLVRRKHGLRECERDNMVVDGDWHFIPSLLPALTVCEDCYDEVISPLVKADSDIAMRFNTEARMIPNESRLGVSCQLYSGRMRDVFRYAVQVKDLQYLDRKGMERREMEERLQRRILEIKRQVKAIQSESARYGRSAEMDQELKLLVREERDLGRQWVDWE